MKLSVVIPFYNEEQNVVPVVSEIRRFYPEAQVIAVDDCSTDGTYEVLCRQPDVLVDQLPRHLGQSAAIYRGLTRVTGEVCVLMDGDGQSNAADIKLLLEHFPEYDFVNGCRVKRSDKLSRVLASKIANSVRNLFTRDGMRDTGGTPKALKRECIPHLIPFDGLHRFIPALLRNAGFHVLEIPVSHRERIHGQTKYTNAGRAVRGAWDLIGVSWLLRRRISAGDLGLDPTPRGGSKDEGRQMADRAR